MVNCILSRQQYPPDAGLLTAAEHPDRVKTLVLGEPPVIPLLISNINNPLQILSLLIRDYSTGKSFLKFGMKAFSPAQKQLRKGNLKEGVRLLQMVFSAKEDLKNYLKLEENR